VSEVGEKRKTFSGGERSKSFWKEKVFLAEGRSETLAANYSGRRERREERERREREGEEEVRTTERLRHRTKKNFFQILLKRGEERERESEGEVGED